MHKQTDRPPDEPPDLRLRQLLQSNGAIVYHYELPDPEYPFVKCSIYGSPKTNELFARLTNGTIEFVAVAPSPVIFPVMADRILGLNALDHAVAFELADQLWEAHRAQLVDAGSRKKFGTKS